MASLRLITPVIILDEKFLNLNFDQKYCFSCIRVGHCFSLSSGSVDKHPVLSLIRFEGKISCTTKQWQEEINLTIQPPALLNLATF